MFNIIVPTDFSPIAQKAAGFAGIIASNMDNAQITLFNCIETSDTGSSMVHKVEDILIRDSERDIKRSVGNLRENLKEDVKVEHDLAFGDFVKTLTEKAKELPADLIIMGTHGAGGVEKIFFGSNTAKAAEKITACPILVVPQDTKLKGIEKIIYATDLKDLKAEAAVATAYAKLLGAHLEVLHITDDKEKFLGEDTEKTAYMLMKENDFSKISFRESYSYDILDEIGKNAGEQKADMVLMFSRQKTYFERLFDRSFTKEMAFHTNVPLMIIPYELVL
jgi:nucleotide-binding universal stress UspA family protein